MKLHRLFVPVFAALALAMPAFAADDDTPLSKEMEKVSKALKVVNRNLADPASKDANLAKLAEAKTALDAAAKFEPAMTKSVPAAEKEKFLADYKASMEQTAKSLGELTAAVTAGDKDAAAKVMEKLTSEKKEAHKKFKKDE